MFSISTMASLLAFIVGYLGSYYAQRVVASRRSNSELLASRTSYNMASKGLLGRGLEYGNSLTENKYFMYALTSGAIMVLMVKALVNMIGVYGIDDYYAILMIAGFSVFTLMCLILFHVDIEIMKLPSNIIYFGGFTSVALLIGATLYNKNYDLLPTMGITAALFLVIYFLLWAWRPGIMGDGDVRLAFFTGAVTGWLSIGSAVFAFISPWLLVLAGVILLLPFKRINRKTRFAFGPWIIAGALIGVVYGSTIINWLINLA